MSNKWWTVAAHEYTHHVKRKGFILSTLGLPLMMVLAIGLLGFVLSRGEAISGVGYVDQGTLTQNQAATTVITSTVAADINVIRYADESLAKTALEAEEIAGYVVIPADYLQTGVLQGFAADTSMPDSAQRALSRFIRQTVASNAAPEFQKRLRNPIDDVVQRTTLSARETTQDQAVMLFLTPYLFGIFLMVSVFVSSSNVMTALVEEKENRVMEILATSIKPFSLMLGKIIGLGLLGLTQILIWLVSAISMFMVARSLFRGLENLTLPMNVIVLALVMFVPTYMLVAAALSAIGAAVSVVQEGQQLSGVVSLLMVMPLWFLAIIIDNPNGPLAVMLSVLPFTSPLAMMQRIALTDVPFWQILASITIQSLAAFAMIWLASRVLRVGMLRYGKRLNLKDVLEAMRGKKVGQS